MQVNERTVNTNNENFDEDEFDEEELGEEQGEYSETFERLRKATENIQPQRHTQNERNELPRSRSLLGEYFMGARDINSAKKMSAVLAQLEQRDIENRKLEEKIRQLEQQLQDIK